MIFFTLFGMFLLFGSVFGGKCPHGPGLRYINCRPPHPNATPVPHTVIRCPANYTYNGPGYTTFKIIPANSKLRVLDLYVPAPAKHIEMRHIKCPMGCKFVEFNENATTPLQIFPVDGIFMTLKTIGGPAGSLEFECY